MHTACCTAHTCGSSQINDVCPVSMRSVRCANIYSISSHSIAMEWLTHSHSHVIGKHMCATSLHRIFRVQAYGVASNSLSNPWIRIFFHGISSVAGSAYLFFRSFIRSSLGSTTVFTFRQSKFAEILQRKSRSIVCRVSLSFRFQTLNSVYGSPVPECTHYVSMRACERVESQ